MIETMLRHALAHADSIRRRERCSSCKISPGIPTVGRTRPAAGNAAGTEAVAHRTKSAAGRDGATACNGAEARSTGSSFRRPSIGFWRAETGGEGKRNTSER